MLQVDILYMCYSPWPYMHRCFPDVFMKQQVNILLTHIMANTPVDAHEGYCISSPLLRKDALKMSLTFEGNYLFLEKKIISFQL